MDINLCFHGIGRCVSEREPGESHYWITERLFHGVLDEIGDRADVRLSFDDGNRSDVDIALPALTDRGLRATFFVLAGRLHDPASLAPDDLRRLRAEGMQVGTHGWSHVPWRRLGDEDADRELVRAREVIADVVETAVREAAFPLGRYDGAVLRRLRRLGYSHVYTSDRFPARARSWLQARYSLTADDTMDTVRRILERRPGPREARNLLASAAKRLR